MKSDDAETRPVGAGGRSDNLVEDVGFEAVTALTANCTLLAADAEPGGHPCCKLVGLELTSLGGGPKTLDGELTLSPVFAVTCELESLGAGALAFGAGGTDAAILCAGGGGSP